jgi:ribosomal protein S18 acetylase RimI-like enzyme
MTSDSIEIRRARPEDAQAIAELHVRVWQCAYRGLIPDSYLDGLTNDVPRRAAWRAEWLARPGAQHRCWVAVRESAIVAFADTGPSRDQDAGPATGELYSIHVDESVARRGIGRLLLEHAIADLRRRDFEDITLWVLDTNERARSFYEALGWREEGATKVDARDGFALHEVRYQLRIGQ